MKTEIIDCKRTCAITGASSGIGKATAIELAKRGFHLILIVRNCEKSRFAFDEITKESGSECISMFYIDLASFESIRNAANKIKKQFTNIDLLINNAGIFTKRKSKSSDGFELTLAVNYLAPFLLTNLLLPAINKKGGRIINLSSELYKKGQINSNTLSSLKKFNAEQAYANSKLLINYFTKELALKLSDTNISVNSVHPGVVGTAIFRDYPKWFTAILKLFITKPKTGAQPIVQLATIPEIEKISGKYFYKFNKRESTTGANSEALSKQIWKKSFLLTQLNEH